MSRTVLAFVVMFAALTSGALLGGCGKDQPPPAPPAPAAPAPPPPAPAPAKPKMVANPDGLSLADRIAKREAAEKKLADELASQEKDRLLKYDKGKLPVHTQVFAFIKKARGQYDALEKKIAGASDKAKAKQDVEKLALALHGPIEATGKKMATIDPKGGNSNVTTDYDVMLNALATDYPAALSTSLDGDPKALNEQKAELDKRTHKIEGWLAEVKKAKK